MILPVEWRLCKKEKKGMWHRRHLDDQCRCHGNEIALDFIDLKTVLKIYKKPLPITKLASLLKAVAVS